MQNLRNVLGWILIILGITVAYGSNCHALFVRPELTRAQAFWEYLPYVGPAILAMIVGRLLLVPPSTFKSIWRGRKQRRSIRSVLDTLRVTE